MIKGPYFIIQDVLSLFITTMIWYMSYSFLDVALSADELNGTLLSPYIIVLIGGAFYLLLTVVYIILGAKRIDDWRPWMIAVNIAIHVVMFGLGFVTGAFLAALTMMPVGLTQLPQ